MRVVFVSIEKLREEEFVVGLVREENVDGQTSAFGPGRVSGMCSL